METDPVLLQVDGRLARITLNRPDKRNALNNDVVARLTGIFNDLSKPGACKLAVLSGAGDAFCAGADLASLQALQEADMAQNLADSESLAQLFKAMYNFPGVLLAAVNGHALAGGCGLVTLCDIAVAKQGAKFGYTETRIGFVPALVARYLMEKINKSDATRLLLGAQIVEAHEALRVGLIHEVVPADQYDAQVEWWIDHIMHSLSAEALASTKKLIRIVAGMDIQTASDYASRMNAAARMSNDCKRGIKAFIDKETIRWT